MNATPAHKKPKGFTLIETIVSVTILATAIVGPLTLSAKSIQASRGARLQLEATYLAVEGVEIIHSIRNNFSAADGNADRSGWLGGGSPPYIQDECSAGCAVDVTEHGGTAPVWDTRNNRALDTCTTASQCQIIYNITSGVYRQRGSSGIPGGGTWIVSPFTRTVTVTTVSPRQAHVTSTVTYESNGTTRTIVAEDDIYNWFPEF